MIQLQLVNTGGSVNMKNDGLFTYLRFYRLSDWSLNPLCSWGLWKLCQLGQTGVVRLPAMRHPSARHSCVVQEVHSLACSGQFLTATASRCAVLLNGKTPVLKCTNTSSSWTVLRTLFSCKTLIANSVVEASRIHFMLFILILALY